MKGVIHNNKNGSNDENNDTDRGRALTTGPVVEFDPAILAWVSHMLKHSFQQFPIGVHKNFEGGYYKTSDNNDNDESNDSDILRQCSSVKL